MKLKRVSIKVAKAIKEAGYPLTKVVSYDGCTPVMYDKELNEENWADCDSWYLPTYMDVWLWLWRSKGLPCDVMSIAGGADACCMMWVDHRPERVSSKDPEEAIAEAIEYLVEHDLIN